MTRSIFFITGLLFSYTAWAQQSTFDYRINDVQMFEVDPARGDTQRISNLDAYLYDIGPMPYFVFKVEVEQLEGKSLNAGRTKLNVERYMLLQANNMSIYEGLNNEYPDVTASPAWTYHGPVDLKFSRKTDNEHRVWFTSEPLQISFLDPDNPITFARPADYSIIGFAYRFVIDTASLNYRDKSPADNAFQLTFLKP